MKYIRKKVFAVILSVLMIVQIMPTALISTAIAEGNVYLSGEVGGETYHEVEFYNHNNALIVTQYVKDGSDAILPEDPVHSEEGWRFSGWKAAGTGTVYPKGSAITVNGDMSLTAQYVAVPAYTVTIQYLDTNDSAVAEAVVRSYYQGETDVDTIPSPQIPDLYPDQVSVEINPATLTADTTITVRYQSSNTTYEVQHWFQNVDLATYAQLLPDYPDENKPGIVNTIVSASPLATIPEGYSFSDADTITLSDDPENPNIVKVRYNRNLNTLVFDMRGGAPISPKNDYFGVSINLGALGTPARQGYTFAGWTTDSSNTTLVEIAADASYPMPAAKETTLYAVWAPAKVAYKIVYWLEKRDCNGIPSVGNPADYVFVKEITGLTGFTDSTVNGETIVNGQAVKTTGGLTANAVNGETGNQIVTVFQAAPDVTLKGDGTSVLNVYLTRKVFTFTFSWNEPESTSSGWNYDGNTRTRTETGYACRFKFKDGDGTYYSSGEYSIQVKYEQDVSNLWPSSYNVDFQKVSRTRTVTQTRGFWGWGNTTYSDWSDWGNPSTYDPAIAWDDIFVSHRWTVNPELLPSGINDNGKDYSTGFNDKSRTATVNYWVEAIAGESNIYGTETSGNYWKHTASQSLTLSGNLGPKDIEGFITPNTSAAGGNLYNFYYNRLKFTLTYNTNGGGTITGVSSANGITVSGNTAKNVPFEKSLTSLQPNWTAANKTKIVDGVTYTFAGWYYDAGLNNAVNWASDRMPNKNLTVFAKWQKKQITLTSNPNYTGSSTTDYTMNQGGKPVDLVDPSVVTPVREGYRFIGWFEDESATIPFSLNTPVFTDKTIYAGWERLKVSYTVRYLTSAEPHTELRAPKVVEGLDWGHLETPITEFPVPIMNFRPTSASEQLDELFIDSHSNIITFYYTPFAAVGYQVLHLYHDGEDWVEIFTGANEEDVTFAERIVRFAKTNVTIDGVDYYPDYIVQSKLLTANSNENVITFRYHPYQMLPYTIEHWFETDEENVYQCDDSLTESYKLRKGASVKGVNINPNLGAHLDHEYENRTEPQLLTIGSGDDQVIKLYYRCKRVSITVTKIWDDNNNQDGIRPTTLDITLTGGGSTHYYYTLKATENWKHTFGSLPKYKNGNLISYVLSESKPNGYNLTETINPVNDVGSYALTGSLKNSHTPETVTVPVKKVWKDKSDQDGIRPDTLAITLTGSDGNTYPYDLSGTGNEWTHTFGPLPKYYNEGTKIDYTLAENQVPAGYTESYNVDEDGTLTLTNTHPASTTETIQVQKALSGRDFLASDSFEFTLAGTIGSTAVSQTLTVTDGTVTGFDALTFPSAGTYTFTITESAGSIGGLTYDTTPKTVTVSVVDNQDGTLTATASPKTTVITNTYKASSTTETIQVQKALSGRDFLASDSFEFTLAGTIGSTAVSQTLTVTDGTVTGFDALTFPSAGTYTFTITESAGSIGGLTYDTAPKTVTVSVVDNQDGTLTATASPKTTVITNTYKASSTTETIQVQKALSGRDFLASDSFEFTLAGTIGSTPVSQTLTVTDGTVTGFDALTFPSAGTYTFTITESAGSIGGLTYDTAPKTVTVSVVDNQDGTLTATASPKTTVITNTYKASSTTETIQVQKALSGRDFLASDSFEFTLAGTIGGTAVSQTLTVTDGTVTGFDALTFPSAGTYTFTITESAGSIGGLTYDTAPKTVTVSVVDNQDGTLTATASPKTTVITNTYKASSTTETIQVQKALSGRDFLASDSFEFTLAGTIGGTAVSQTLTVTDGTVTGFDALTFPSAGTYTFTITESAGSIGGLTYDTAPKTVTVSVVDNQDGTLTATASPKTTVITNTYKASSTTETIQVQKALSGRDFLASDSFEFTLAGTIGGTAVSQTLTVTDGTVTGFDALTFPSAGTYTFTITESAGSIGGLTYDTAPKTVTVSVVDNQDGTLTATASPKTTVITNTYKASSTTETIQVQKALSGRDFLASDSFEFTLAGTIGSTAVSQTLTVTDGTVTGFDALTFPSAGTYTFTITESAGSIGGLTYDTAPKTVTVSVVDNQDGTLTATASPKTTVITNTYKASSTTETIQVQKALSGRDFLASDSFEFTLAGTIGSTAVSQTLTVTDGTVTGFDALTFPSAGTYTFTITESAGSIGGLTYDTTPKTVTVSVVDNQDGTLTATASPKTTVITNTYKASSTTETIQVQKALSGRDFLASDSFEFTLAGTIGSTAVSQTLTVTDGTVTGFDALTFPSAGTYTFTITESAGSIGGLTYDTTPKTVTVSVVDNQDGTLTATASPKTTVITNTYKASSTTETIQVQKALSGRDFLASDSFEFTLAGTIGSTAVSQTLTVTDGTVTGFDALTFPSAGTYTFTITESAGSIGGLTYDTTPKTVTVSVVDNQDGTLTATASPKTTVITNTYKASSTTETIQVQKALSGRDFLASDSFEFTLAGTIGSTAVSQTLTVTDGTVTGFDALTFPSAGTYTFTITESAGSIGGLTYDTTPKTVTVSVVDNQDGTLTATASPKTTVITNTYKASSTTETIQVQKALSGRDFLASDSFEFTLAGTIGSTAVSQTLTVTDGTVTGFDALTFPSAGTYTFTITESAGSIGGLTYDTTPKTVTVSVVDNQDGTLTATASPKTTVITNTYKASSTTETIQVQKALSGRDFLASDSFEFTLAGTIGSTAVSQTLTVTDGTVTGFDALTFPSAGTYTFTITESAGSIGGLTYDTAPKTVTVSVVDNQDGTLTATASPKTTVITNTYKASSTTETIQVQKALSGRDFLASDSFEFTLAGTIGGTAVSQTLTVTDGTVTGFDALTFPSAGTYTFTITESAGSIGGLTYDTTPKTVTVSVVDNQDGTLTATASPKTTVITNTYKASSTTETIQVQKALSGRDFLASDSFEFTLAGTIGSTPVSQTLTVTDGTVTGFDALTFPSAGTYTFTITESAGSIGGLTYDTAPKTVTVSVVDNQDGTLTATASPKTTVITNTYKASSTTETIQVQKALSGRDFLASDSFEFTLAGTIGGTAVSQTLTVTDGTVTGFDALTFPSAGTYTFTITESAGSIGGLTYDTTPKTVTVSVVDNQDGTLTATASPKTTVITNTYKASSTTETIQVQKALSGRDFLASDSFEFTLAGTIGSTAVSQTLTVTDGTVTGFDALTFPSAGTYTFTITESAGSIGGLTYDTAPKTVTVSVVDNQDGTLTATASPKTTVITNTYKASSTTETIQVQKALSGRDFLASDSFEFTLAGTIGGTAVSQTLTVTDGTVTGFDALTFPSAGTYTFTITESAGSIGGLTYDTTPKTVTVSVVDNQDGTLTATASPKTTVITNTYKASSTTETIQVQKALSGRDFLASDSFEFTLAGTIGSTPVSQTLTVTDGTVTGFDALTFPSAGTYTFTITESAGSIGGLTYDTAPKTVTVSVVDNQDGTLTATASPKTTVITNTYKASSTTETIQVQKALSGRDFLASDSFEFTLAGTIGGTAVSQTLTVTDGTVTGFDALTFPSAGTYTFTITESAGSIGGLTYDTTPKTVTVSVVDNQDGTLTATASPKTTVITNTYKAEGELTLSGSKTFTGRASTATDVFEFKLYKDSVADANLLDTQTVTGSGTFTFDTLYYYLNLQASPALNDLGDHTYVVVETVPATNPSNGITYDTTVYTVVVTVTDAGDGTLNITSTGVTVSGSAGVFRATGLDFTNTYKTQPAPGLTLKGLKTLNAGGRLLKEHEFEFELSGTGYAVSVTTKNAANGSFSFALPAFTDQDANSGENEDTYTYIVKELVPDPVEDGMTYASNKYTVVVTVKDNGAGQMVIKSVTVNGVAVTPVGGVVSGLNFTNIYKAKGEFDVDDQIGVTKKLDAGGRLLKQDEFEFTLSSTDDADNASQTVKNNADGTVVFANLKYDQEDIGKTYTYKVAENIPDPQEVGMTYSANVLTFKVKVTDAGGGVLIATKSDVTGDTEFVNVYKAKGEFDVDDQIGVTKKLDAGGRLLKQDEFEFTLSSTDDADNASQTVKNNADGTVVFANLKYDQEDIGKTYTYKVAENIPDPQEVGMTYSANVLTFKVKVTDAGGGVLIATKSDVTGETEFVNTYEATGTLDIETTINPTKSLTGRELKDGDFTFDLHQDNMLLQSVTNEEGNILFKPLAYTEKDIGQTYSYTITERKEAEANITYSTLKIEFTVLVEDAGNGVLKLTVNAPANVIFFNTYTAPTPEPIPDPDPVPVPPPAILNFDLGVVPGNVADCLE